jgi:mRNA interferase RelE/StbE
VTGGTIAGIKPAPPAYRLRQAAHRVVYSIEDEQRVVEVVEIGHRREVYR